MDPLQFTCPHCSARLRVRDKLYVGRQVACPECREPLLLVQDQKEGGIEVRPIPTGLKRGVKSPESDPPAPVSNRRSDTDARASGKPLDKNKAANVPAGKIAVAARGPAWWSRPLGVLAGITVGVMAILVLVMAGSRIFAPLETVPEIEPPLATINPPGGDNRRSGDNAEADGAAAGNIGTESRLKHLSEILEQHVEESGAFPRGTHPAEELPPERRLSWMATLANQMDPQVGRVIAWDRPWNDPVNEAFVRRRVPEFQNPSISQLAGGDGYPATHFVGMSGVGANAAEFDLHDPRSGIFGNDRQTRLEDIRDGLSQTLLILGVRDNLGSWGAGGNATIRGLTREPYVNGPDGFGTGAADSMFVLLADGRVQTVSAAVAPQIVRRMAAMADGLPLDTDVAGEPGDILFLASDPAGERPHSILENEPLDPEFAEDPQPVKRDVDVAQALTQRIARFDQPRSRPLSEVLMVVGEMVGSPIAIDRDALGSLGARLDAPAPLKLENTTVGEILEGLLNPVGLTYRIESNRIRLIPRY